LLGQVSDPRTLFAAADVFALSSRSEGLPNVLLESLACGVPVVATAVGGVPRVITDERNGLLIRPDDADGLSVALSRLLHNDALKSSLIAAGRRTLEERYSFDVRMQKLVAVYGPLLTTPLMGTQVDCSVSARRVVTRKPRASPWDDVPQQEPSPEGAKQTFEKSVALVGLPVSESFVNPELRSGLSSSSPSGQSASISVTSQPHGWSEFLVAKGYTAFSQWPEWSHALAKGLGHQNYFVQAKQGDELVGVLPLQLVESRLFGRFLVSLPYVNTAGVVAESDSVATALVDRAIELADALDVKHLELRHEVAVHHPKLVAGVTDKVHMRLPLPATGDELWNGIKAKVRNQIRKAQKTDGFSVHWGGEELLPEFYDVFCRNMRDLGTPPFSRRLFAEILRAFPTDEETGKSAHPTSEVCVVRLHGRAVASGLLIHGPGTTQVPSASSLREFNANNANMLLYWNLLARAIERGQSEFDFGRSSRDSGTYRFKAQWGAVEHPAVWQHYVRRGQATDMRPTSGKFPAAIKVWQRLPVWLTKLIGPSIVRGIP
jgi:FemAB-related protein (PEP-CTERM system-associated)